MKVKTSITLSEELLGELQTLTSDGNRSDFIEKALWQYMKHLHAKARNERDLKLINAAESQLNKEAADTLLYQVPL
jgi:metal-responsive CopG/Arc/MetJ family transcriptional regulator